LVFDINPDGTLSNMRMFTIWGGDGMSMDDLDDIYISNGQGVMGFDPNGNNILTIPLGASGTNNTFAGRDDKLLFITDGAGRVSGIKMSVKGVPGL
jgi:sugar lactone lactonase YvrE